MFKTVLAALAAFIIAVPASAQTRTFTLSYSAYFFMTPSDAVTTTATITTDDGSFYGGGGYLITGITGTRDSQQITGLADPYSEIYYPAQRPDMSYSFDTYVDNFGFTFTAGGVDYQVYRDSSDTSFYHEFGVAHGAQTGTGRLITPNSFSITPTTTPPPGSVPEPASWAMMVAGFAAAGLSLRRRRAPATAVALA